MYPSRQTHRLESVIEYSCGTHNRISEVVATEYTSLLLSIADHKQSLPRLLLNQKDRYLTPLETKIQAYFLGGNQNEQSCPGAKPHLDE